MANELTIKEIPFAGVNLKVIAGHPEHDILFIAKQVADAAGLKNGSTVISNFAKHGGKAEKFLRVSDLQNAYRNYVGTQLIDYPRVQEKSYLLTEPQAYRLLLRGHAPQSEAFRKWVTEEVLPTIRKTGRYDIAESTTEEAKQFAAEFAMLRNELTSLRLEIAGLKGVITSIRPISQPAIKSPYEGQSKVPVCDVFSKREFNRQCEVLMLDRTSADRIAGQAVLILDKMAKTEWAEKDGRVLETCRTESNREWALFPKDWLTGFLNQKNYRLAITKIINDLI